MFTAYWNPLLAWEAPVDTQTARPLEFFSLFGDGSGEYNEASLSGSGISCSERALPHSFRSEGKS